MALGRALAVALVGLHGHVVEVEADIATGLPTFGLVGLPDASLQESRDRVRAAAANSGFPLPQQRITVNLSPAALPKAGTGFDLAVAAALLSASGTAPAPTVNRYVHIGELGLDGRVRPVRGVLPAVLAAVEAGRPDVVVPYGNQDEAKLIPGARVWPVRRLTDVVLLTAGRSTTTWSSSSTISTYRTTPTTTPAAPPHAGVNRPTSIWVMSSVSARLAMRWRSPQPAGTTFS